MVEMQQIYCGKCKGGTANGRKRQAKSSGKLRGWLEQHLPKGPFLGSILATSSPEPTLSGASSSSTAFCPPPLEPDSFSAVLSAFISAGHWVTVLKLPERVGLPEYRQVAVL